MESNKYIGRNISSQKYTGRYQHRQTNAYTTERPQRRPSGPQNYHIDNSMIKHTFLGEPVLDS